ncbi:MAG: hypothetical protein K1X92_17290 [Bacteroidia bacterium]|nr:hypothetical protein [Bacteroidia bacterium]
MAQKAEHLPATINSEYEEREPTFSPDGKVMYYWRRKTPANTAGIKDNGDIWISTLENGQWTQGIHPTGNLNTPQQNFVWQVSPDDDTLWTNRILYIPNQKDAGIGYHTRDKYGNWTDQKSMELEGYAFMGNYKDYFITPQRVLLVTNIGEDTYGGTDIYAYFPVNDTLWGNAVNLGVTINTPGDEDAPFLSKDGKILYFGSNGHRGGGDHDIFYSQRLDNSWRNWSKPAPVGMPVNSQGYDYDFMITPDEEWAYWCSDQNTFGGNDIFRMRLNTCELTLYPEREVSLCQGDSVKLEAGFSPGNVTYRWLKNGIPVPNAYSRELITREAGNYRVIRVKKDCIDTSSVRTVTIKPVPVVSLIGETHNLCENDSILLMAIGQNDVSYQWYRNGKPVYNATKSKIYIKYPGDYTVKVSNGNCDRFSSAYSVLLLSQPYITHNISNKGGDTLIRWSNLFAPNYHQKDYSVKSIERDISGNIFLTGVLDVKKERSLRVDSYDSKGRLRWSNPQVLPKYTSTAHTALDNAGNLYITTNDFYLIKYSGNGVILWQKDIRMEKVTGIATDPAGNIITTGRFTDTLMIDGEEMIPGARGNLFVAKHNPTGKLLWVRTYRVDNQKSDFGNAVSTDCAGNIYVGGRFERVANFVNPVLRALSNEDQFFLTKLSPNGKLEWAKKLTAPANTAYTGDFLVKCDGMIDFLANGKLYNLNASGGLQTVHSVAYPGIAQKVRIQSNGNKINIAGLTREENNYFLLEMEPGNQAVKTIWIGKHAQEDGKEVPAIRTDDEGNLYFAGSVQGTPIYGASPNTKSMASITVAKYGIVEIPPKPTPLHLCPGETVELQTQSLPDVKYQWFRNGKRIPGSQSVLTVSEAGEYNAQVINNDCVLSTYDISVLYDCIKTEDKKEKASPDKPLNPIAETKAPPVEKLKNKNQNTDNKEVIKNKEDKKDPIPPKVTSHTKPSKPSKPDLVVNEKGSPVNLKKRKVKLQNDFTVENNIVKISVWDYAAVDRDTISLNINGKWVLEAYGLQKNRKVLEVEFKPDSDNYIILYAHNLGAIPPNTITIAIDDGVKEKVTRLESDLKTCGYLRVKTEKKKP